MSRHKSKKNKTERHPRKIEAITNHIAESNEIRFSTNSPPSEQIESFILADIDAAQLQVLPATVEDATAIQQAEIAPLRQKLAETERVLATTKTEAREALQLAKKQLSDQIEKTTLLEKKLFQLRENLSKAETATHRGAIENSELKARLSKTETVIAEYNEKIQELRVEIARCQYTMEGQSRELISIKKHYHSEHERIWRENGLLVRQRQEQLHEILTLTRVIHDMERSRCASHEEVENVSHKDVTGQNKLATAKKLIGTRLSSRQQKKELRQRMSMVAKADKFDSKWYLQNNPDVAEAKIDPLLHYVLHGAQEGRAPNSGTGSGERNAFIDEVRKNAT